MLRIGKLKEHQKHYLWEKMLGENPCQNFKRLLVVWLRSCVCGCVSVCMRLCERVYALVCVNMCSVAQAPLSMKFPGKTRLGGEVCISNLPD